MTNRSNNSTVSLGILHWGGLEQLIHIYRSFDNSFLSFFREIVIVLQETKTLSGEAKKIFEHASLVTYDDNIGIYGGFKRLFHNMSSDYLLLLENDHRLIEPPEKALMLLKQGLSLLQRGNADIIRLRSTKFPGNSFSLHKYYRYYPKHSDNFIQTPVKFLRRKIRPQKAKKLLCFMPYAPRKNTVKEHGYLKQILPNWYLGDSNCINWTNQSCLLSRELYHKLLIQVDITKSKRLVNGFKNIETQLNSKWWRNKGFNIAISPGFITHDRINHRGY